MGKPDFRLGGKIFATLASEDRGYGNVKLTPDRGYGNVKLTPEQKSEFVAELPEVFLPVPGGWG